MNDSNNQLPIKAETDSPLVARAASHPTTGRMVNDLLSRVRRKDLDSQRCQVGNYFLCLPDYQQILLWSEYFNLEPIKLISILDGSSSHLSGSIRFSDDLLLDLSYVLSDSDKMPTIVEGRIIHIFWSAKDIGGMPPAAWVRDLQIRSFIITGNTGHVECLFAPKLPALRSLEYYECRGAISLDLTGCPNIESLTCRGTYYSGEACYIEELRLAGCQSIKRLDCSDNQLTSLSLSCLDQLESLDCSRNKLDNIDLSNCQSLKVLNCSDNQLTSLSLSCLDQLESLDCSRNKLDNIDLSTCQSLKFLDCSDNQFTSLSISGLEYLEWLQCYSNNLDYDDFMEKNRVSERFASGDVEIERFSLSVRVYNILKRSGIDCIKDLRQKSYEDIAALKNMGEKRAQEVIHQLEHQAPWTFSSKKEPRGPN